ncbi:MAG: YdcF family protein [Acidobacteria bacterium]|nr:YdcF family protein [Acidobacteriota bacterium]
MLAQRANPLWEFLAVADPPAPADVIFVFGSQAFAVPARAAELFRAGYAPVVLVTGHYGRMTRNRFPAPEALVFRDRLMRDGVPAGAVVTEPLATNTLENVRFGLAALDRAGVDVRRALLVAKPFVMRRCTATFDRQAPDVDVRCCPPTTSLDASIDREPGRFAARLVAELDRLDRYGAAGDITPQAIPAEVRAAAALLNRSPVAGGAVPQAPAGP